MSTNSNFFFSKSMTVVLFIMSVVTLAFWFTVMSVDVYESAVGGAIYEMLSISMLLSIGIVPIVSLIILIKKKTLFTSFAFYAILISLATVAMIWYAQ